MIDRTIHHVWLGPDRIPGAEVACAESWARTNPEFEIVLWTDRPEAHAGPWHEVRAVPPLVNAHAVEDMEAVVCARCRHGRTRLAAQSDMIRYEIVARYGGVYADLDVEAFRAIDELIDGVRLLIADECGPCEGNYLIAAEANHPAMWTVVRELPGHLKALRHSIARGEVEAPVNPVVATGPRYVNAVLRRHPDLVILPWPLFNPLWAFHDPDRVEVWPEVSFGNHHYYGRWYSRRKRNPPETFMLDAEDAGEVAA